jgi:anti-repressor protein
MNNNIIPVFSGTIASEQIQLVNARELHSFLEVGRDYSTWIKDRIDEYDFVENQDFISFPQNGGKPQGGRPVKEYSLTLDMAKELSMVERNEKGKQARRYFIDCEKALHHHPLIALLNPSNPVMTVSELYIWRAKVREALNAYIENSISSITLVTTAEDYLSLLVTKDTPATALIVHSTEGGAE